MTNRVVATGDLPPLRLAFASGTLEVAPWPTVTPMPSGPLWKGYGICAHPNFGKGVYADTDAWTQKLADIGPYACRGMFASNLPHVQRTLVRAKDLGLRWTATIANLDTKDAAIRDRLELIAQNLDVFIGIEGINEPDRDGLTPSDVRRTVEVQELISDFVADRQLPIAVLSPALQMNATRDEYQRLAGVAGKFHVGSVHHYNTSTRDPHTPLPPTMPPLAARLDEIQEMWGGDRFWVTEGGNTNVTDHPDPRRAPEAVSAAYAVPTILEFLSEPRVEKFFRYELLDDPDPGDDNNEAHFGLFRADGSPKPEVFAVMDFLDAVRDGTTTFEPAAVELEVLGPDDVRWLAVEAHGRGVTVLAYRPGAMHDTAPVDVRILTPSAERTVPVGGTAVAVRLEGT